MDALNPYFAYYAGQDGGAGHPYYRSRFRVQAGRGWFGNLLKSAWSFLRPLASGAAKHAGKEALKIGSNVVQDVLANPNDSIRQAVSRHGKEGLMQIAKAASVGASAARAEGKAQTGQGRPNHRQSSIRRRRARITPLRRGAQARPRLRRGPTSVPPIRDIFSPPSP